MSLKQRRGRWLSLVVAIALLTLTLLLAEPKAVATRLLALDPTWLLLGVVLSIPTYLVFSLRWFLVTRRLGAPLRYPRSLREYYLGTFVNQTLPTGLAGAALRTMRHARSQGKHGQEVGYPLAIQGVVLERISGLAALALFALVGVVALREQHPSVSLYGAVAVLAMGGAIVLAFVLAASRAAKKDSFVAGAKAALLRDGALLEQVAVSSVGVVLLVLGFYCAARATEVGLSLTQCFFVAPLILGAMVIPLAMAGWGVREAAAAALFGALGSDASTGVAVSIAFGLIGLVSSLPGLVILLLPGELGRWRDGDIVEHGEELTNDVLESR